MTGMTRGFGRRRFLQGLSGMAGLAALPPGLAAAVAPGIHTRSIPASGQRIPVIGLGSAYTFDVAEAGGGQQNVTGIMQAFFDLGGGMLDSSPMYGRAETRIGKALAAIDNHQGLFSATKVWIPGRTPGVLQMEHSLELWGLESFDLIHVHNLVDWEIHLPWLREWKQAGRVRHVGVTTSHGRRHEELENILRAEDLDFVQFTYNVKKRVAEQRLLPLCRDRGIAVVVNRPFERGGLFRDVRGRPLPAWAAEIDCANWAQFFLKFIVSHPDVTCAIPATTNIDHLRENMGALHGRLPHAEMRRRMAAHFDSL
jgi:diketogulonate reductase-like aldo/keto reductase